MLSPQNSNRKLQGQTVGALLQIGKLLKPLLLSLPQNPQVIGRVILAARGNNGYSLNMVGKRSVVYVTLTAIIVCLSVHPLPVFLEHATDRLTA
jgi:hypothetical protein